MLGLGNIGPKAAMPVMEGKAVLFKQFGGVDAVPICLDTQDVDQIVAIVTALAPSFGGINLEDISAPRCFEIERRLDEALDIPVFHDDQHGTAVVVLAALRNAVALLGRRFDDLRVVISGAGAAGVAITKMLIAAGVNGGNIDRVRLARHRARGPARPEPAKARTGRDTNAQGRSGGIQRGADRRGRADRRVRRHDRRDRARRHGAGWHHLRAGQPDARGPPHIAAKYAAVVATGRSDFPNQINNVLAFPGIFRGALDARATTVTERMKVAAADAIA